MDILHHIQEMMPTLSKGQKAIGQYMLDHYDKAAYMTAFKLGSIVNVSESTVVRFAIELGFEGYPDLQHSLRELIRTRLTSLQRIEIANDRIGDNEILDKVINYDIDKMKSTLDSISREAFNDSVDMILNAKTVYIMGVRSSAPLAQFMYYYFNMILPSVKLINTTGRSETFEQLLRLTSDDLFIGITFPRYSKRIIQAMEYAKGNGASTVSITDSEISPVAPLSDKLLVARSDMASFVDSLVAPLSIINAMIVALGKKKKDELTDVFGRLEEIWDKYEVYNKNDEAK